MRRNKTGYKFITPKPYFEINFGCSNRAFYAVLNDIIELGEDIFDLAVENVEDNITQKRDYEGDLERLIIYDKKFIDAILKFYDIPVNVGDMDLHLTIF